MNFCIDIDIDVLKDSLELRNAVGELLRDAFFEQKIGIGGYDVYDVKPDVVKLSSQIEDNITWQIFEKKFWFIEPYKYRSRGGNKEEINVTEVIVIMKYTVTPYQLMFVFENETALKNGMCADGSYYSPDWELIDDICV